MTNSRTSHNSNALMLMFVTLVGMLLAVGLVYSVLTARGNNLSQLTLYAGIGCFIAGLINPKGMLYVFVFATAYLDLLKRLLIFFDRPTVLDLYFVMGLAPLIMLGILCGVILGGMTGRYQLEKRHWNLFIIATGVVLITAAFAFRHTGTTLAIKRISNSAAYAYLLFALPVLFRSWPELWKLCRFALFIFIPVGLYAIYQSVFGLRDFEIEYLKSGLTIMVKELHDVRPRPFSTMNAAHTLSYMSAILMIMAYIPFAAGNEYRKMFRHRSFYGFLIFFYFVVCFVTMARSGHFLWMAAFGGMFAFFTMRRTALFYSAAVSGYAVMVVFSDWFLEKLPVWDAKLNKSSDLMLQATRIQTFSDRLHSYAQLKRAETYSLFGLDHEIFFHDAITESLARYGLVPLLIGGIVGALRLTKIHKTICEIVSIGNRKITCLFLSIAFGVLTCDVFFGSTAKVFPISAYMWAALGGVLIVVFYQKNELPGTNSVAVTAPPKPQPQPAPTPQPQFIPAPAHFQNLTTAPTHDYPR